VAGCSGAGRPHFDGSTYEASKDHGRLWRQLDGVRASMRNGTWMTLSEMEEQTGFPQASISARLRDLRKPKFGGYTVERRRRGPGLHEYRLVPKD
jgi:hypothetical protein